MTGDYFEPSFIVNGANPKDRINYIVNSIITDRYKSNLESALLNGNIRAYCVKLLKTEKCESNIKCFKKALYEVAPELVDLV